MPTDVLKGESARILVSELQRRDCSYVVLDRRLPVEAWEDCILPSYHRTYDLAVGAKRKYEWRHDAVAVICEQSSDGESLDLFHP